VENVACFDVIDSTHKLALRLIEQTEKEELTLPATVVIARRQEAGIGRLDRRWESPPGGLYLSWICSGLDAETIQLLPMLATAAAVEALNGLGTPGAEIKWPNDILINGHKVAGLLTHARHGETTWAVVSLGVNVETTPDLGGDPDVPATSLSDQLPPNDRASWTGTLIPSFISHLTQGLAAPSRMVESWRSLVRHQNGDSLTIRLADGSEIRGSYAGLTDEGHLKLDVDGAETTIPNGDVVES
jgi:BirA family biotin operon repressor/biotin-[acetyl-CoA-carboxylase] ligase